MTCEEAFVELLACLGAEFGGTVLLNNTELNAWPHSLVTAMKSQGLVHKTRPAKSTVCSGCEHECVMPVQLLPPSPAFIVCDKRSDISRIPVPIDSIEQWQFSCDSLSDMLAGLLGLRRVNHTSDESNQWEIGLFKGIKHSSHLMLLADENLKLSLAGYAIAVDEVLFFDGKTFKIDKHKLTHLVDQPASGGGNVESADQRRDRLKRRVLELQSKGVKAFLKTTADEEGIGVSRLKQILMAKQNFSS